MNQLHSEKAPESHAGCTELLSMAERELSAFFRVVTQRFGSEQARITAEDWLHEVTEIGSLPTTLREWRAITVTVASRLAIQLKTSSLFTESQILGRKEVCAFS